MVVFGRSPSKVEILKTIFVRTCVENYNLFWSKFEMNVCFEELGGMCALFYENQLGLKKSVISLFTCSVRISARNSVNTIIQIT